MVEEALDDGGDSIGERSDSDAVTELLVQRRLCIVVWRTSPRFIDICMDWLDGGGQRWFLWMSVGVLTSSASLHGNGGEVIWVRLQPIWCQVSSGKEGRR